MAVAAVRGGLSKSSVARAAGIATSLLYFWLAGAPKAKRLRLVEASAAGGVGCDVAPKEALVFVRLASGVEIDIPRSELSVEVLATLTSLSEMPQISEGELKIFKIVTPPSGKRIFPVTFSH